MAKRSIEGYQPRGLSMVAGHRYTNRQAVAELIGTVEPLPDSRFNTVVAYLLGTKDRTLVERSLSARAKFILGVEHAARSFHFASEERRKPTALQLASEFEAIEKATERLLQALQVGTAGDLDRMPYALRYDGVQASAEAECNDSGFDRCDPALFLPAELAVSRVRASVRGIVALKRWATAARARADLLHGDDLKTRRQIGREYSRNDGAAALDEYLCSMIVGSLFAGDPSLTHRRLPNSLKKQHGSSALS